MKLYSLFSILFVFSLIQNLHSQDINYARKTLTTLASPEFYGRGYTNKGDLKAANFIAQEFKLANLSNFSKDYFQKLSFPINTIESIDFLSVDGKTLTAGSEFLIDPASKTLEGSFNIVFLPDSFYNHPNLMRDFFKQDLSNSFVLTEGRFSELKRDTKIQLKGIIYLNKSKLTWHASQSIFPNKYLVIETFDSLVPTNAKQIQIKFTNKFKKNYKSQNVVGFVKGKIYPDSFFVITAHYDHLGMMGKTCIFPGANDNASGTTMLLNLAKHYSLPENQPNVSIVFMAFCGEEAGIIGSSYAASHPLFNYKKIKFLLNIDMVGTGSEGITVVNATKYESAYNLLASINKSNNYLVTVNSRGESCNSDHCPFYQMGVPSFFIFSMGKEHTEYHNIYDVSSHVPLTKYNEIFRLLTDFIQLY